MIEENNAELITTKSETFESQPLARTNFFVSFAFLAIQVFIPGLVLFFLTSKDFSFTFKLPLWLMIVLALAFLLFASFLTLITYKMKWHQLDQFTYVVPFAWFIIGFYLTSYWLDYHYFLIRFIIAFVCAVVGIALASILVLVVVRRKNKLKIKN